MSFNVLYKGFRRVYFYSLLIIGVACSPINSITPLSNSDIVELIGEKSPTPEFITFVTKTSDEFETSTQDICAFVNEYPIWETGDFGNAVSDSIQKHARVFVNGQQVRNLKFRINPASQIRFSEINGSELGSHNFSTHVCFDVSNLNDGMYIATLQFLSTTGVGYSHTWVFELKNHARR